MGSHRGIYNRRFNCTCRHWVTRNKRGDGFRQCTRNHPHPGFVMGRYGFVRWREFKRDFVLPVVWRSPGGPSGPRVFGVQLGARPTRQPTEEAQRRVLVGGRLVGGVGVGCARVGAGLFRAAGASRWGSGGRSWGSTGGAGWSASRTRRPGRRWSRRRRKRRTRAVPRWIPSAGRGRGAAHRAACRRPGMAAVRRRGRRRRRRCRRPSRCRGR